MQRNMRHHSDFVECQDWDQYGGNCYSLIEASTVLTWMIAEQECKVNRSHLVSIKTREEMLFIHSILLTRGIGSTGVYIGRHI